MPHQNTVIHEVLKQLPWYWLDRAVEKYGADELSRTLTTKQHVIALLYGQMSGATSLREIVAGMESHAARLYHLGSVTNDLDAKATDIAALYKQRWQIELFFRWVKQTLRIKRFIGVSENAVRIQIAIALIAFVLLRLAQAAQTTVQSPLAFARLVRANLMHRRPLDRLLEPPTPTPKSTNQLSLQLC
jgi:IS4 transposase